MSHVGPLTSQNYLAQLDPVWNAYLTKAVRALKVLLFPHWLITAHALNVIFFIV